MHSMSVEMFPGMTAMCLSRRVSKHKQEAQGKREGNLYCWHRTKAISSLSFCLSHACRPLPLSLVCPPLLLPSLVRRPLSLSLACRPLPSAHPTGGALISASPTGTLTSAPLTESVSVHSPMSALLLKLQSERQKREALQHEVNILKKEA